MGVGIVDVIGFPVAFQNAVRLATTSLKLRGAPLPAL